MAEANTILLICFVETVPTSQTVTMLQPYSAESFFF